MSDRFHHLFITPGDFDASQPATTRTAARDKMTTTMRIST